MKRYIIALLLLCSMVAYGYSWQQYRNFMFQQELNYGWAYPAIQHAMQLLAESYFCTKITNKKVCTFIREQLVQAGVEEPECIAICRGYNGIYCAGLNYIAMHDDNYRELKQLLHIIADPCAEAEEIALAQEKLDMYIALIQHEAAHLKYHDNFNMVAVLASSGGAIDWVWHKIAPLLGAEAYTSGREQYNDLSLIKLTALSLVKKSLCYLIGCAYSHMVEWRADGNIANDKKILVAGQKFFAHIYKRLKKFWEESGNIDLDEYPYFVYIGDPRHPRADVRAQACADRIAALERMQAA